MGRSPVYGWIVAALIISLAAACGAEQLPVGYDDPAIDEGGPRLEGGLQWIQTVWPRTIEFARELEGGPPTVMFLTNWGGVDTVHELGRRLPMDVLHFHPDYGNEFPGRERFHQLLNSREQIDCFVISRYSMRSTPADVQYEILSRVRDGAGLVMIDDFDRSKTFSPKYLEAEQVAGDPRLIEGIPYDGLREWRNTESEHYVSYNYWNTGGSLSWEPQARPFEYASVDQYRFGDGTLLWISTGTHWARARRSGRTLLPHVQQNRSMYVETDYYYSHTARAILRAAGRERSVRIAQVDAGPEGAAVSLAAEDGPACTVRWQIRDTWGIVTAEGEQQVAAAGGEPVALDGATVASAGRHFLDVWVDTADGATCDWASAFVNVERGQAAPTITPAHPEGTARGEPLRATVEVPDAPADATVRVTLVDRYWREVHREQRATGTFEVSVPTEGLDGQIWTLHADVLDGDGNVLARAWENLTSPDTRATRGGFHPVMTVAGMACPEEAARREYLRRLGFLANRPYSPGNELTAEAHAWTDVQMHPFAFNLKGATSDYTHDAINDWEDPQVKAELEEGLVRLTNWQKPFGHRGFNFTDDSGPAKQLAAGAYTTQNFHEWLREEYGGVAEVGEAWGLREREFHSLARVHKAMVEAEYEKGNTAPWIDARRFMQDLWVERMAWLQEIVQEHNPEAVAGSDAGYYGAATSALFGEVNYLCPYYRQGGRPTKIAVARGAARRDGDYGACIGSYGDKPQDMSGRRGQLWDILFAGGTGLYYWSFSVGMHEDMTLSDKHARYQLEVMEEFYDGIGELFTGCERIFDPIAIVDSQESAICDELEQEGRPLTSQVNSMAAFMSIFEDLALNAHIITGDELAAGWARENGIRALALAGANSLSDEEIAAVRAFAEEGGAVIADVLSGRRLPNGNLRAEPPLLDFFGVNYDESAPERLRGELRSGDGGMSFGPALADPRIAAEGAVAGGELVAEGNEAPTSAQAIFSHEVGSGSAHLFNASFSTYDSYRSEPGELWRAWQGVVRGICENSSAAPAFGFSAAGEARGLEVSAFRNAAGYLVGVADLGFGVEAGQRRGFEVTCPGEFVVYEVRSGRLLAEEPTNVIRDEIPPRGHRAYALLPYRVAGVSLQPSSEQIAPGDRLTLTVDLSVEQAPERALHVVRIDATAPDGESFFPMRRVLRMPDEGALEVPLTFAHDDPPGEWQFTATDVISGEQAHATVRVGGEA
jgi:hypothetical protein